VGGSEETDSRGRTVAEGLPRTAYGMRTNGAVVGRRFRSVTKLTTKVRIGGRGYLWGSFLIAAAALKTPTRNGYNAQGVNLKSITLGSVQRDTAPTSTGG